MTEYSPFWIVWNAETSEPADAQTQEEAQNLAQRLAQKYPGRRYFVMKVESFFEQKS